MATGKSYKSCGSRSTAKTKENQQSMIIEEQAVYRAKGKRA
jgi:hypothetical protein